MNTIYLLAAVCTTSVAYGQTTVFEKNKEAALVNGNNGLSKTITTEFIVDETISSDEYLNMITIMEAKDGYVSCTLQGKKIILSHEDWVKIEDIVDMIKFAGITAKPLARERRE